jgi:hypothetical protein
MKQMVGLHIKFLTYGLKHPQIEVWLFWLYGQWVELGFVVMDKVSYGFLINYSSLNMIDSKKVIL